MKTREEILQKIKELDSRMDNLTPDYKYAIATTQGQKYILEWVLTSSE
jgi:hypothetical protein